MPIVLKDIMSFCMGCFVMFECDLCGHEMLKTTAPIKVNVKRKIKEVQVPCYRCTFCKNVGLSETQILQLPDEVNLNDFQAFQFLQRLVSLNGLKKAGLLMDKEEEAKEEVMYITA